jgi:hypothetical protein
MVSYQYNHLTGQWQVMSDLVSMAQDEQRYFIPALPGDPPARLEIPADVSRLMCHGIFTCN